MSRRNGLLLSTTRLANIDSRHRISTAFVPEDRKYTQVTCSGQSKTCVQYQLQNKCLQIDSAMQVNFHEILEVESQQKRCKACNVTPQIITGSIRFLRVESDTQAQHVEWKVDVESIKYIFKSSRHLAVVDRLFFLE